MRRSQLWQYQKKAEPLFVEAPAAPEVTLVGVELPMPKDKVEVVTYGTG